MFSVGEAKKVQVKIQQVGDNYLNSFQHKLLLLAVFLINFKRKQLN